MQKIGLVYSKLISDWKSVESITRNLRQSYEHLSHTYILIDYNFPYNAETMDVLLLADKIISDRPDKLIFIDHYPVAGILIKSLFMRKYDYSPEIYVHIYGNFTYCASDWYHMESVFLKRDISFIFASETEMKLFMNFTLQKDNCFVYPFPVCKNSFYFDKEIRKSYREELECTDEFIIVYSGRLSLQKNVSLMATKFKEYSEKNPKKKLKLFLAGFCDDIGSPFHYIYQRLGHQHFLWEKTLSQIPENIRSNIVWLGNLKQHELLKLYNAADCYLSFSLHHDEDYGMAPREALFCGTPCILTSWGGFADLGKLDNCHLMDITFDNEGMKIDSSKFDNYLDKLYKKKDSIDRDKVSQKYFNLFSPEETFLKLYQIIQQQPKRFMGFNYQLENFFRDKFLSTNCNSFYKKIYNEYI